MGANTSIYTKNSPIQTAMRDYPWSTQPTAEQLYLDIPLEVTLWGLISIFMTIFVKIGCFGLITQGDFRYSMIGDNLDNPNMIYKVDVTFYLFNGVAYIIKASLNTIVTIFAMIFFSERIQLYDGVHLDRNDPHQIMDIIFLALLPLSFIVQMYTALVGGLAM